MHSQRDGRRKLSSGSAFTASSFLSRRMLPVTSLPTTGFSPCTKANDRTAVSRGPLFGEKNKEKILAWTRDARTGRRTFSLTFALLSLTAMELLWFLWRTTSRPGTSILSSQLTVRRWLSWDLQLENPVVSRTSATKT